MGTQCMKGSQQTISQSETDKPEVKITPEEKKELIQAMKKKVREQQIVRK